MTYEIYFLSHIDHTLQCFFSFIINNCEDSVHKDLDVTTVKAESEADIILNLWIIIKFIEQ